MAADAGEAVAENASGAVRFCLYTATVLLFAPSDELADQAAARDPEGRPGPRLSGADRDGQRRRGVALLAPRPRLPERPPRRPPHPEPRRPPAPDLGLAGARAEPLALLSAREPAAPLGGDDRLDALPRQPPRERRRPHPDRRSDRLGQEHPRQPPRRLVVPLPGRAGLRLRRRLLGLSPRRRGRRQALRHRLGRDRLGLLPAPRRHRPARASSPPRPSGSSSSSRSRGRRVTPSARTRPHRGPPARRRLRPRASDAHPALHPAPAPGARRRRSGPTPSRAASATLLDADRDDLESHPYQVFELSHLFDLGERALLPVLTYLFHRIEQRLDGRPDAPRHRGGLAPPRPYRLRPENPLLAPDSAEKERRGRPRHPEPGPAQRVRPPPDPRRQLSHADLPAERLGAPAGQRRASTRGSGSTRPSCGSSRVRPRSATTT